MNEYAQKNIRVWRDIFGEMVNSLVYDSFPFIKCIDNAVVVGRMPLMTDDSEWIKIQNDHFILTLYYGNFQICTELDRLLCRATYLPPTFTFTYQSCLHSSVLVLSVIKTPFFGGRALQKYFMEILSIKLNMFVL